MRCCMATGHFEKCGGVRPAAKTLSLASTMIDSYPLLEMLLQLANATVVLENNMV